VELDRDEKIEQILAAAQAQLREAGYERFSVAALARELGIAQNAVYWYFPSKDELVVATVEAMLRDIVQRKPPARVGLERQVLWFVDQLAELSELRGALAYRAVHSEVVADFLARSNDQLRRLLTHALEAHVVSGDLDVAVDVFLAAAHGTYVEGLTSKRRREVLSYLLAALTRP
jgi:TetR/AcrR family transcriptional regulator, repressor of the mexAB-oprM multidrug resistance operon